MSMSPHSAAAVRVFTRGSALVISRLLGVVVLSVEGITSVLNAHPLASI